MSAISSGIEAAAATASNSANRFADLDSQEFLRVLFTELQNQDPLEPQDSSKMLEQLSSLRNIESQLALQEKLEDLVGQNQVAAAGALIGKLVTGLDSLNNPASGQVMSVRVTDDGIFLELDSGQSVDVDNLTRITSPPAAGG